MSDQSTSAPAANQAPAELYPGHAADLARKAGRDAATAAAHANPLPGPLADAFWHVPQTVAGLTVRPLVHYDFVLLKKLDSPLLKQLQRAAGEADKNAPTEAFSDEQGYEMVFQFTRSAKEAAACLARGREAFRQAAIEQIGMSLNPVEVSLLVRGVEREFVRAFATAQKYGSPPPAEADGTVFTVPPAGPMTGSVGGSTTSAGC